MPLSTLGNNLVDRLVPMVDSLRSSLYPSMGVRQYRVMLVRRAWDGGEVGAGNVSVLSQTEILPQPAVSWEGREFRLGQEFGCGLVDAGSAVLEEVSLTFTESELLGRPLTAGQEFYYRITDAHGQGIAPTTWIITGVPTPDREQGIGWIVKLKRYDAISDTP